MRSNEDGFSTPTSIWAVRGSGRRLGSGFSTPAARSMVRACSTRPGSGSASRTTRAEEPFTLNVTTGLGAPIHRTLFSMGALFATVPSRTTSDAAIRAHMRPGRPEAAAMAAPVSTKVARVAPVAIRPKVRQGSQARRTARGERVSASRRQRGELTGNPGGTSAAANATLPAADLALECGIRGQRVALVCARNEGVAGSSPAVGSPRMARKSGAFHLFRVAAKRLWARVGQKMRNALRAVAPPTCGEARRWPLRLRLSCGRVICLHWRRWLQARLERDDRRI